MAKRVWIDRLGKRELETCYCASWDIYELFLDEKDKKPCTALIVNICRSKERAYKNHQSMKSFILEYGADAAIKKFFPLIDKKFDALTKFKEKEEPDTCYMVI